MKQTITYDMLKPNTQNGFGIQIHYTITSFDGKEILDLKDWYEKHIGGGVLLEPVRFKTESEVSDADS